VRFARVASLIASFAAGMLCMAMPVMREASADPPRAHAAAGHCARQKPQGFLIRGNYLKSPAAHNRSLRYRVQQYGHLDGIGPSANPHPVSFYLQNTSFLGLPIQVNRRIIPAMRCVEADLQHTCARTPYRPKAIGGYRDYNSYRHGEVTNHLFGIAIDIDPQDNPCCGCVEPWPDNPRCKGPASSIYERMAMPECWVKVFARHGFYWLGHDQLQDTMHYEFLGNPDRLGH